MKIGEFKEEEETEEGCGHMMKGYGYMVDEHDHMVEGSMVI